MDPVPAVIETMAGVDGVRNLVTLTTSQPFSADQATARITAALQRDATIDAQHVHVGTGGSAIELTGTARLTLPPTPPPG